MDQRTSAAHRLFWGDLHKHMTGPGAPVEAIDDKLRHARAHLDFSVAYCYPFEHYEQGDGVSVETTGGRPAFQGWWEAIQNEAERHHEPGTFVTFPAYEWHGNRRRWGDHHIVYREPGYPLDDTDDIRELSATLAERPAFLIPHHTAYRVGERGKDWDVFDPALSPVMEVYSTHGSSEGVDTPVPMSFNKSMGPRTDGGTFQDAIARDHHIGLVASNDGPGVPGAWNRGLAGVWAAELTRDALWDAIAARRTYGVTGDRITLWWTLAGRPMGSTVDASEVDGEAVEAAVEVDCPRALDRIELLRNDTVVETYTHQDEELTTEPPGVYRLLFEFGWGPTQAYGPFEDTDLSWSGHLAVNDGSLGAVYPRFSGPGQSYEVDGRRCRFSLLTSRDEPPPALPEGTTRSDRQGLILEIDAGRDTSVTIDLEGHESRTVQLENAIQRTHLFPLYDTAAELLEEVGIAEEELGNMDRRYHVSPKVKVHRAHPRHACATTVTRSIRAAPGDSIYVRASQVDGQFAWGSPITVSPSAAG